MTIESITSRMKDSFREFRYSRQLERILKSGTNEPPNKLFGSVDDEYWYWLLTEGCRKNAVLRDILPGMPEEQVQLQSNGLSGDVALRDAFDIYMLFKKIYEEHCGSISHCDNILDFGVGWGRVIRFFLKDLEPEKIWGIDHYAKVIDVSKQTNKWCNFQHIEAFPPTSYADGMFDLIFCYSVFSHLSEDAHRQWLEEFRRLLKPGGLLLATTWQREFLLRCQDARAEAEQGFWTTHLGRIFVDTEHWLAHYDSGGFCWESAPEYGDIAYYLGETCIPKGYVLNEWTKTLDFVDFIDDRSVCPQNLIVMKR